MICLAICTKCSDCIQYTPSKSSEDGCARTQPMVRCRMLDGGILLMDSDLPEGCPYILEHKLCEEEVTNDYEELKRELNGR